MTGKMLTKTMIVNDRVLTEEDCQRIRAANQLIEHVAVDSFDGVDQLPIILVGQPLIEQFTAPQVA